MLNVDYLKGFKKDLICDEHGLNGFRKKKGEQKATLNESCLLHHITSPSSSLSIPNLLSALTINRALIVVIFVYFHRPVNNRKYSFLYE
jgi:hypothetical protein